MKISKRGAHLVPCSRPLASDDASLDFVRRVGEELSRLERLRTGSAEQLGRSRNDRSDITEQISSSSEQIYQSKRRLDVRRASIEECFAGRQASPLKKPKAVVQAKRS